MNCFSGVILALLLLGISLVPSWGLARKFKMLYAEYQTPEPLYPAKLRHQIKANKAFTLKWKQDERAESADILIIPVDAPPLEIDGYLRGLSSSELEIKQGLKAGQYRWQVITSLKGEMDVTSKSVPFTVYPHIIEKGGFKLEYGISNARYRKLNYTERVSPTLNYRLTEQVFLHELTGYYIFTDWFGLGGDWQMAPSGETPWGRRFYRVGGYLHVIGGSSYYAHLFALGYREMVVYESYPNSSGKHIPLVMRGIVIGNEFSWALSKKIKFNIKLQYFKPLSIKENLGSFTADIVEQSLGFGYNAWNMLWVNLFYRDTQSVVSFVHNEANGKRTRWTTKRVEPLYLSISYNY